MTWQIVILAQILVSSLMTLFTRHVTLSVKKVYFGVGVLSYIAVALMGWVYAVVGNEGFPTLPDTSVWPFLLIEGICIPAAWLVQYRLISYIGASSVSVVAVLNTLTTALLGLIVLHESVDLIFVIGAMLVLSGVILALSIQPDIKHRSRVGMQKKVALAVLGAALFGVGMLAEKIAVTSIGVWDYTGFGWTMQALGALSLLIMFGRKEISLIRGSVISLSLVLGILTSVAGGLYVYALAIGSLSHTIIATSGKAAIVLILAALFLAERNQLQRRVIAFILTMTGLALILL